MTWPVLRMEKMQRGCLGNQTLLLLLQVQRKPSLMVLRVWRMILGIVAYLYLIAQITECLLMTSLLLRMEKTQQEYWVRLILLVRLLLTLSLGWCFRMVWITTLLVTDFLWLITLIVGLLSMTWPVLRMEKMQLVY